MIITYFRSSSYNCWDICPQQYFLTYVLGTPSPSGKKAEMGTILHKVMEGLAHGKKCIQDGNTKFVDDVFGTVSVNADRLADPQFVEWLFEKSFTYYSSPAKSIHTYTPRDKRDIWTWCCDALEFQDGMFDPRKRHVVEAEPHFDIPIKEPWAQYEYTLPSGEQLSGHLRIKGTIDLVTSVTPAHYEVIDWKSGECKNWATGKEKDYEDFCVDPQLRLYHLALHKLYPKVKSFAMTMNYVRTKGPFTVAYDDSDVQATLKMLRTRFERIKATVRPKLKSLSNKHWFCKRVCWFGKNPHSKDGSKTMCQYIAEKTRRCGIEAVMLDETEPGHTIGHYHNPGS